MAPVKTHVRIGGDHVITIRTFLNKQQIEKNRVKHPLLMGPQVSPNQRDQQGERYPVRLSKCKKMIISNRHLRELYNDPLIKKKIMSMLFELDRSEIFAISGVDCITPGPDPDGKKGGGNTGKAAKPDRTFKDTDPLMIPFSNETWRCRLDICWNDIESIRNWISGCDQHLVKRNWKRCEELLVRKLKFTQGGSNPFGDDLESQQEEEDDDFSAKKNISFYYEKIDVCPIALNIHVHSKV